MEVSELSFVENARTRLSEVLLGPKSGVYAPKTEPIPVQIRAYVEGEEECLRKVEEALTAEEMEVLQGIPELSGFAIGDMTIEERKARLKERLAELEAPYQRELPVE